MFGQGSAVLLYIHLLVLSNVSFSFYLIYILLFICLVILVPGSLELMPITFGTVWVHEIAW